jgi:hypothetical protein
MNNITEVCYSISGQRYHRVIRYEDHVSSKCHLISNLRQRYSFEFEIIGYDEDRFKELELEPYQHCFGKKEN